MKKLLIISCILAMVAVGAVLFSHRLDMYQQDNIITVSLPEQRGLIIGSKVLVRGFTRGKVLEITHWEQGVTLKVLLGDSAVKSMSNHLTFAIKKGAPGAADSLYLVDLGGNTRFEPGKHYVAANDAGAIPPADNSLETGDLRSQMHYGLDLLLDAPQKVSTFEKEEWPDVKKSIVEKASEFTAETKAVFHTIKTSLTGESQQ